MNETIQEAPASRRIEDVFDRRFIELLELVPKNPHVRALILKMTGLMPGVEVETYEQIRQWAEAHCRPRLFRTSPETQADDQSGIQIPVHFSDWAYGNANYSVARTGSGTFVISDEGVMELTRNAVENGEDMECLVTTIGQRIEEGAWEQCEPDMDDEDEYNYSDHNHTDSGDGDAEYSRTEIRAVLVGFLQRQNPEILNQLQT